MRGDRLQNRGVPALELRLPTFQEMIVRLLDTGVREGNSVFSQGQDSPHPTVPMPQTWELKLKEEMRQDVGEGDQNHRLPPSAGVWGPETFRRDLLLQSSFSFCEP